jgi:hypothetical protein
MVFASSIFFKLGDRLPESILKNKSKKMILSTSSQLLFCYDVVYDGILISYGINELGVVEFIKTSDSKFKTIEGLSIQTKFENIPDELRSKLKVEPSWAYYIPIKNDWNAAFIVGDNWTERTPVNDDQIAFFFQRE